MLRPALSALAAASLAGAALAQDTGAEMSPESDWRPVVELEEVDVWYDADLTLARDGLTRVITRKERVHSAPVPEGDGGAWIVLAEILMLDCAARTYTSVERKYYDAGGQLVLETIAPDGPKPYADGEGVEQISGMVC